MNKTKVISEKKICFYFDNGFCKYSKSCKFIHPESICGDTKCSRKSCEMRHPKVCRYYQTEYGCKFRDKCLFKHDKFDVDCDICENLTVIIEKDKAQFNLLLETVKGKDSKLDNLQAQIESLKYKNKNITLEKENQHMVSENKVRD